MQLSDSALSHVVRDEAGFVVAALARWCGDLAVAEEAVADAIEAAVVDWRVRGVPAKPGAWLHTVARRRALDALRRSARYRERLAQLGGETSFADPVDVLAGPDDRLGLLFACCHPSLGQDAQLALTLRAVIGLTTRQIARAFLTSESTITRRISRVKQKIVATRIPLVVPPAERMAERLGHVLAVVYLAYNEGYISTSGPQANDRDLASDALWLAGLVAAQMPEEAESIGLHALLTLLQARTPARWDDAGALVRLADQDRSRWDRDGIAAGLQLVQRAGSLGRPGPFQLQAAVVAVHSESATYEDTDWPQIVMLYDMLRAYDDSTVIRLNRAVALSHVAGPEVALADVDALASGLDQYHLFHAVRAHLLRAIGDHVAAHAADAVALGLTQNVAEREVLRSRLAASEDVRGAVRVT